LQQSRWGRKADTSWQFRPLTEEEKKEFESSLDSEGKRMLEELSGKRKSI
jgi:ClpP class serine protease